MPKGVPANGFRRSKNWRKTNGMGTLSDAMDYGDDQFLGIAFLETDESDQEIDIKLKKRFTIFGDLVDDTIKGDSRALIVSGPPGLSKSWTVEKKLESYDPDKKLHTIVKGFVRPTGLFRTFYDNRFPSQTVVFDDADSIFFDDTSLNLLKAVCDTTEDRWVSYLSETEFVTDKGETIPKTYKFEGSIIFITNYDFDRMIEANHKLSSHLSALMSRSHYMDLAMKSKRDCVIRIRQVVMEDQMLIKNLGLSPEYTSHVMEFIEENINNLRELSLRMALKIGVIRRGNKSNWDEIAKITCCKGY